MNALKVSTFGNYIIQSILILEECLPRITVTGCCDIDFILIDLVYPDKEIIEKFTLLQKKSLRMRSKNNCIRIVNVEPAPYLHGMYTSIGQSVDAV
jgi:hypothetical protein